MAHNTTIELSTYYALYQFLKANPSNKYTVANRARKVSTVTIMEDSLHFDIVKGSEFDTCIVKSKFKTPAYSLIGKLGNLDAQVKADLDFIKAEKKRIARESLVPGDLDKAFSTLERLREQYGKRPDLMLNIKIRNNKCARYELRVHETLNKRIDITELDNNSALIHTYETNHNCHYDDDICNQPIRLDSLIEELEAAFCSWLELKLIALAEVVSE